METKTAFLKSTGRLAVGMVELACYRIVGNTACMAIWNANVLEAGVHKDAKSQTIKVLRQVTPPELTMFRKVFADSYLVVTYSWLESYLDDVEEVLLLCRPENLGESVQVKLGKILDASSIEVLVHDIVRKKIRERGQWSIRNRLDDLCGRYQFTFSSAPDDITWMSDVRNEIVHDRGQGRYKLSGKRLKYEGTKPPVVRDRAFEARFMRCAVSIMRVLYDGTCKTVGVATSNKLHRENLRLMGRLDRLIPETANKAPEPTPGSVTPRAIEGESK